MSSTTTPTPTYLATWQHPQLAAWEKEDLAATGWAQEEDDAYRAARDAITKMEGQRKLYNYQHETLPATERRVHDDKVADMANDIREARRAMRMRWPDGPPNHLLRAIEARTAMRVADEGPLRLKLKLLDQCDADLLALRDEDQQLAHNEQDLEAKLAGVRAHRAHVTLMAEDTRLEWRQAADVVGFTGEPTVDRPPRQSGERLGLRYEPSLFLGINATERDVALRESFERAATN